MKIFRKSVLILLALLMILAAAVPSMAVSQKRQLESIIIYRSVERVTTEMRFATVAADEVTATKETISFPGYEYPVEVYKAKGKMTINISDLYPLKDVCIYKYDPDTGNRTLIGKADSWKVDGYNIYYTRGLIKNISEPGTYVITCTFAFEMQEPLAAAVKVEAGETAEGDTENTGGSKLLYFRDVPSGHWAHDAVMDMVKIKLFNGTTEPDEKGAALFEPDRKMTYAQFIAVVTRYICPDYVEKYMYLAGYDGWWYKPYCSAAVEAGISDESGYDQEMYTLPVTRERMAKILVKACNKSGEGLGDKKYTDFPDYDSVSPEYRDYVAVAYAEGLLCGVNDAGKFDPKGTLTRAQAATVLYRLVDPSARVEI